MLKKRQSAKAILDVKDVALEWDSDPDQRTRMRDEKSVLKPGPAWQDISTCIQHRGLLIPLLERMAAHDHRPVPQIDALKEEVLSLLKSTSWELIAKRLLIQTLQKLPGRFENYVAL